VTEHTQITFYLSQYGGKFHLPNHGWDADVDHAACRRSTMLDTRINAASVMASVALIEAEKHSMFICERCARAAVRRAGGDQS
jgi:hypothetical protein